MSIEETKSVLAWRNHETIKTWMYNQNDISLEVSNGTKTVHDKDVICMELNKFS